MGNWVCWRREGGERERVRDGVVAHGLCSKISYTLLNALLFSYLLHTHCCFPSINAPLSIRSHLLINTRIHKPKTYPLIQSNISILYVYIFCKLQPFKIRIINLNFKLMMVIAGGSWWWWLEWLKVAVIWGRHWSWSSNVAIIVDIQSRFLIWSSLAKA